MLGLALTALAACLGGGHGAFAAPPVYDFAVAPAVPVVGQTATFTASGLKGKDTVSWDFNNDGVLDATGAGVQHVFATAGQRIVLMRVTNDEGEARDVAKSVLVDPAPAGQVPVPAPTGFVLVRPVPVPTLIGGPTAGLALMSPFPIVRIVGNFTSWGATVRVLAVRNAPRGARVTVRCRGRGCPVRSRSRAMPSGRMRLRFLERGLRAGVLIRVFVTQPGKIGKYTSFRIRRARPPLRRDGCVVSRAARPQRCPSS